MMPLSNLKTYSLFLFAFICAFSCEDDDGSEIIKMRINHYAQPGIPSYTNGDEFLLIQVGGEIGSGEWKWSSSHIRGLDFELGYTYDVIVKKEEWCHGCQDVSGYRYTLKKLISKTKTPDHTTFEILLAYGVYEKFVLIDEAFSFKTTNGINIQCESLCEELSEKIDSLESNASLYGVFEHVNSNTIRLVGLNQNAL